MKYLEVSFTLEPFNDIISETLTFYLAEIGFDSFITEENKLIGYIIEEKLSIKKLNSIINDFPIEIANISYDIKKCEEKDWNEEWEKNYFNPIIIGEEVIIKSTFHKDVPHLKYNIFINPKMAFGTGHHQTTRLMVEAMMKEKFEDKRVLDMGCGTGILGIFACLKGAKDIVAIDIDKWSYDNIIENLELNKIEKNIFKVKIGDASILNNMKKDEFFDIVLANINRNVLIEDLNKYSNVMKKDSIIYLSGFYKEDIPLLEKESEANNLKKIEEHYKDNWALIKLIKTI